MEEEKKAKAYALSMMLGAVDPDTGWRKQPACRGNDGERRCDGLIHDVNLGDSPDRALASLLCGGDQMCMVERGVPARDVGLVPRSGKPTVVGLCASIGAVAGLGVAGELCIVGDAGGLGITLTGYGGSAGAPTEGANVSVGGLTSDTTDMDNLKGPFDFAAGSAGIGASVDGTEAAGTDSTGAAVHTTYVGGGLGENLTGPLPASGMVGRSNTCVFRLNASGLGMPFRGDWKQACGL
jgi:hypothetical protein